jgi:2'-5' RNA ligase
MEAEMMALMKRMSKYVLVYLPSKEVSDYNQKLVAEVGPKFGENFIIENPRPPHATLKSPFYMEDISKLEDVLAAFTARQKIADLNVEGFDNFRGKVAFLNVIFSDEAKEMQKALLEEIKVFPEIVLDDFDINHRPHLTVAYGNTPESFEKIWEYLHGQPVPKYDLKLDNITLLKKVGNEWKIHRRFDIK